MINKWKLSVAIALVILIQAQLSDTANILAFLPTYSSSHLIIEMAVMKAMAEHQHNVTVVTVIPLKRDWLHPTMTHIQFEKGKVDLNAAVKLKKLKGFERFWNFFKYFKKHPHDLAEIFDDARFQELLQNPENKFDLLVYGYLFYDYFFGLAEHFDCPLALLWPNIPTAPIFHMMGNPLGMSYSVVTLYNAMNEGEGFWFRWNNLIAVVGEMLLSKVQEKAIHEVYAKHFPADKYASFDKAKERVSMVLFSHHFSEKPVRPLVPGLIEIGGIHINDEPKPLPKDLENFIASAEHGVIFFSLGTNIKPQHLQENALKKIYNVLSKLPQKVLWKVNDESIVPGNSSNIIYRKWLPQADILGHPNVKLFFGHGGKGGITEAKFFGVPMVGLPIFGDQPMNMLEVVSKCYGLSIDHDQPLTEEVIASTVKEVLDNPKYANSVKAFSKLYRDRPLKAKDNAVYWLEYLIRYKGAPHMQSPLKTMSFVEAMNLDIFALILAALYVLIKLVKFLVKFVVKQMCMLRGKKSKTD